MKAEIISVGTELLLGQIVDTNSAFLARELASLGIELYHLTTVGDNPQRLESALKDALGRADLVITSGGLGPTEDDLTKETVAKCLGLPLVFHEPSWERIVARFAKMGRSVTGNNKKQAFVPKGGKALENHWGTAPGVLVETGDKQVYCLPGPPSELEPMFRAQVLPLLAKQGEGVIRSRILHLVGIGESQAAEKLGTLLTEQTNPTIAPLAMEGELVLRLTAGAKSAEEAGALLARLEEEIRGVLAPYIYGTDDETLASVVVGALRERGETLATAESCTGGLVANLITDIPGSSEVFARGFVTYSNDAKIELLGVPKDLIDKEGAVSPEVAKLMAEGAKARAGSNWGIGISGIAGPGGGSAEKPVGLVYLALAGEEETEVHKLNWPGGRLAVKKRTAIFALDLLRRQLLRQE